MRALALALVLLAAGQAAAQNYCTVDSNGLASVCTTCVPATGCAQCATSTRRYPYMRVLTNYAAAGNLPYNRCLTCDKAPTLCKDSSSCTAAANGCTACRIGSYIKDTVVPQVGGDATYKGCTGNCVADFSCAAGTACDAGGCLVCPSGRPYKHRRTRRCSSCQDISGVGCTQCYTDGRCKACKQGYWMNTTDPTYPTCAPCTAANCAQCASPSDSQVCQTCKRGYYKDDATGECMPCTIDNCVACAGDGQTCAQCAKNFYVSDNAPNACTACTIPGCTACSPTDVGCDACKWGTNYIADKNACLSCQQTGGWACKACDTTTGFCTNCAPGYAVNATGQCMSCRDVCGPAGTTCDVQSDPATCTGCISGFAVNSTGKCEACSAVGGRACTACDLTDPANKVCTACLPGYFLNTATGQCQTCGYACTTCAVDDADGLLKCSACAKGFYVNPTTFKCASCSVYSSSSYYSCQECNDTQCTRCSRGVYNATLKKCARY